MQDIKETESAQEVTGVMSGEDPEITLAENRDSGTRWEQTHSRESQGADEPPRGKGLPRLYLLALLYAFFPYITILLFFVSPFASELDILASVYKYIFLAVAGVNIFNAITFCKPEYQHHLFNVIMWIKLILMPLYIFGVFVNIAIVAITLPFVIPFAWFGAPTVMVSVATGWVILALQCPYMIAYQSLISKENKFIKATKFIHILLQFFFVADVIDVFVLAFVEKWWKVRTVLLWLFVFVGSVVFTILVLLGMCDIGILAEPIRNAVGS